MGTAAQPSEDTIRANALSDEDGEGLTTQEADFLKTLAVTFYNAGAIAKKFAVFTVNAPGGELECMGKLETLIEAGKKFHFVARRQISGNPEEFVVKVERTNDDPALALPADDPTCGWQWNGTKWVYVCRS